MYEMIVYAISPVDFATDPHSKYTKERQRISEKEIENERRLIAVTDTRNFLCLHFHNDCVIWKPSNKVISVQESAFSPSLILLLPSSRATPCVSSTHTHTHTQFPLFLGMNVYIYRAILISLLFDPKFVFVRVKACVYIYLHSSGGRATYNIEFRFSFLDYQFKRLLIN